MNPLPERKPESKSDEGGWLSFLPVWLGGSGASPEKPTPDKNGDGGHPMDPDGAADGGGSADAGGSDGGGGGD